MIVSQIGKPKMRSAFAFVFWHPLSHKYFEQHTGIAQRSSIATNDCVLRKTIFDARERLGHTDYLNEDITRNASDLWRFLNRHVLPTVTAVNQVATWFWQLEYHEGDSLQLVLNRISAYQAGCLLEEFRKQYFDFSTSFGNDIVLFDCNEQRVDYSKYLHTCLARLVQGLKVVKSSIGQPLWQAVSMEDMVKNYFLKKPLPSHGTKSHYFARGCNDVNIVQMLNALPPAVEDPPVDYEPLPVTNVVETLRCFPPKPEDEYCLVHRRCQSCGQLEPVLHLHDVHDLMC